MSAKTRLRPIALACAAALALGTLAACGGGGAKGGGDAAAVGSLGPEDSASIIWYGWTPGPPNTDKYIAAFNQAYPNIKVEWKQLDIDAYNAAIRPALADASGPDVYEMSAGSGNGGAEVFGTTALDLTEDVKVALGEDWKSKLSPLGVDYMTVNGRLVALSAGAVYAGFLWINQDLFDQFSLTPPKTYDEWKQVCATFEAGGVGCFVQGAAQAAFDIDTLHAIAEQVQPGLFDKALAGEAQWTDPDMIQAFTYWKQLFDDGIMQAGAAGLMQYPEANNAFMEQKYAMVMMGTWYAQYLQPDAMGQAMSGAGIANPEPFTIMPIDFPDMSGKGNTGILFGDADYGNGVSVNSGNQAAAKTFAVWLGTSQAGQQAVADSLNLIPALSGITPDWDNVALVNPDQKQPVQDLFAKAAAATSARFGNISADMNTAIGDAVTSIATGSASPEQAAQTLQSTADSLG